MVSFYNHFKNTCQIIVELSPFLAVRILFHSSMSTPCLSLSVFVSLSCPFFSQIITPLTLTLVIFLVPAGCGVTLWPVFESLNGWSTSTIGTANCMYNLSVKFYLAVHYRKQKLSPAPSLPPPPPSLYSLLFLSFFHSFLQFAVI